MPGPSDNLGVVVRQFKDRVSQAGLTRLTGSSPAVVALEKEIDLAGRCDSKVLISGESGVGKEVVARLIHERSSRRRTPMLAINCAAIPDSLLESELFGHERGSFTGAFRDKPGMFEAAHEGTLFLDEVCEMSMRMQALLLRFLETGETQRVGADGPNGRVDVRVIAATNRDIHKSVAAGEFREDLFFRLHVLHLTVPPLRERPQDIPPLIDHFLGIYSAHAGIPVPLLAPGVMARLVDYRWPGNVRELRHTIECAVVRQEGGIIKKCDLPEQFKDRGEREEWPGPMAPTSRVAQRLFDRMVGGDECFWSVVHEPFMARDLTRDDVREVVRLGLHYTSGNYRVLVDAFHMPPEDYKRFLNFLRSFDCHIPFYGYRDAVARANVQASKSPL